MKPKGPLLCTYIVARYSPQASKEGFLENVPRGSFNGKNFCGRKCVQRLPEAPPELLGKGDYIIVGHNNCMQCIRGKASPDIFFFRSYCMKTFPSCLRYSFV